MNILYHLQLEFLELSGEQVADKAGFFQNLELIQSANCSAEEREAAEKKIHEAILGMLYNLSSNTLI